MPLVAELGKQAAQAQVKHTTLADPSDKSQVGASIPGMVSKVNVKPGDQVEANQVLAVFLAEGEVTLEAVRRVKEELGLSTILGVSNVSFGLPKRELVNTAFFTLALQNGLDCAILNPNNAPMKHSPIRHR